MVAPVLVQPTKIPLRRANKQEKLKSAEAIEKKSQFAEVQPAAAAEKVPPVEAKRHTPGYTIIRMRDAR